MVFNVVAFLERTWRTKARPGSDGMKKKVTCTRLISRCYSPVTARTRTAKTAEQREQSRRNQPSRGENSELTANTASGDQGTAFTRGRAARMLRVTDETN